MKCVGTSLNLKNTYGDGYRINLIIHPDNEDKVISLMKRIAPSNKFQDKSGDFMLFNVPISKSKEIAPLFKLIEKKVGKIES